jgi:hypothetical protein
MDTVRVEKTGYTPLKVPITTYCLHTATGSAPAAASLFNVPHEKVTILSIIELWISKIISHYI